MLKELRKLAYLSMAVAAISFGSHSAQAANSVPVQLASGSCTGADDSGGTGVDCVTTTGHISASVVDTLSINEIRAISFGNMAKPCAGAACTGGDATIALDPVTGNRTATAGATDPIVILLHGADANDGAAGSAGNAQSGGQSPGILRIKGVDNAGTGATQVYISFASNAGEPVDFAGENFWTANDTKITVTKGGASFTVKDFKIDCPGVQDDVYGHYCAYDTGTNTVDVKVGATLQTTTAAAYVTGKYTGTYNAMVSY